MGLGEALVDLLPDGPAVGGAPLNVLVHARALGNGAALVSRIGADEHGRLVLAQLAESGVSAAGVQLDEERPTGTVGVELDDRGEPRYGIHADAAWDHLEPDPGLDALVRRASALVLGSLAFRSEPSRSTLLALLDGAPRACLRLLDLNLRAPFFDARTTLALLERADALKVNRRELELLTEMLHLDRGEPEKDLARRFDLDWIAVTEGARGASLRIGDRIHQVASPPARPGGDPVGAGDAFCAGLLHGLLCGADPPAALTLAAHLGSHVASSRGALPALPPDLPGSP